MASSSDKEWLTVRPPLLAFINVNRIEKAAANTTQFIGRFKESHNAQS